MHWWKRHRLNDFNDKNVHIAKLDTIANKYNNTYHRAIEMKPVDVKRSTYIDSSKGFVLKILNFKLVILLEYFCKRVCSKLVERSFCD